jgi:hypothetical protein
MLIFTLKNLGLKFMKLVAQKYELAFPFIFSCGLPEILSSLPWHLIGKQDRKHRPIPILPILVLYQPDQAHGTKQCYQTF